MQLQINQRFSVILACNSRHCFLLWFFFFLQVKEQCRARFLSHPMYPLDLLTCQPQVHLLAFRQPKHPHFNLCLAQYSRLRGSEREALCVCALDVMHGKWWMEPARWPHTATGRGRHPSGNGCCEDVSAGCLLRIPSATGGWRGYWLSRNWTQKPIIALCCWGLIQGLV